MLGTHSTSYWPQLQVTVHKPDQIPVPAEILELAHDRSSLRFATLSAPHYALGELVELQFSSPRLDEPVSAPSRVQFRKELDGARLFGFVFLDWRQLRSRLPRDLHHLFNERDADRLSVNQEQPLLVELTPVGKDESHRLPLRDLSAGGISLWATADQEEELRTIEEVQLRLELPGTSQPLEIRSLIRYRQLDDEGLWYGVAFQPELTPRFEHYSLMILEFLGRSQAPLPTGT